jgi:predicted house-cleaning NTP pyrophosphatase (Maf/HAM1 superfamily)
MDLQKRFDDGEIIEFQTPTVVLASASPRRSKNLETAGFSFVVIKSSVDDTEINFNHKHEGVGLGEVKRYVQLMAITKIEPFIDRIKNGAVLTADTVACCRGRVLEKPLTVERCREQHQFLSGRTNYAVTAYAVYYGEKIISRVRVSKVKIEPLSPAALDKICAEPETLGAAGYRSSGSIRQYLKIKNLDHERNVQGLDPKIVAGMLEKVGFPTPKL